MNDERHNWLNDLLILIIAVCVISIGCISCSKVQYVPVERVQVDTVYNNAIKVDSVLLRDSVYLHVFSKADTVYSEKVSIRYRDRIKLQVDTIYRSRTDSIQVPYPVERKLNGWERMKMDFGGKAMIGCAVFAILAVIMLLRHIRRKV